ncbi:hypothetical protein FOVSG1_006720 [Fusarium oxysporum f. sp. vasinfectum]
MAATQVKEVCIAVIGAGGVGSVFLKQLAWLATNRRDIRLKLCYIAIIDRALFHADYTDIDLDTALETLEAQGQEPPSIPQIIDFLSGAPRKVIVADNTTSQAVASAYPSFLSRGISIITPNKKAFSGDYKLWQEILGSVTPNGPFVYHESSVGAGMPIISTIKDLVDTGDEVTRIEGVFSGTLSFLFNSFAPTSGTGGTWSSEVIRARELGYMEPDPRDDLNGLDVARKITILGRLAGLPIQSPTSFPVENLIPAELQGIDSVSKFFQRLPEFDERMEQHKVAAAKAGKVVRFIGSVDVASGQAKVGLELFESTHPIAMLEGSDNIISFYTKRYGKMPLTIRGAGAGGDVTAMGVIGDLLKIISQI